MSADSPSMPGRPGPGPEEAVPALAGVRVADDGDVAPLLGRVAADLAAQKLRLAAATRRADAAEALADAAAPSGLTLEEEVAELDRRLEHEHVEHRRRLDAELVRARAEADEVVEQARAAAVEGVRMASVELDIALAAFGGSPPLRPLESPLELESPGVASSTIEQLLVADQPVRPQHPVVLEHAELIEDPGPSFLPHGVRRHPVLLLIGVAIVLILLLAWVW